MPKESKNKKPFVLLILDGWGLAPKSKSNAIAMADTPNFDNLWKSYPHTQLGASGSNAGLPSYQAGNSEAGHMNIGAGRIVEQDAVMIDKEINSAKFFKNPTFETAYKHVKHHKSDLHVMGMLSGGKSAHSDPDHLLALLSWSRRKKIKNVYLHLFMDGRDSSPHGGLKRMESLMRVLKNKETSDGRSGEWVATIAGRFWGMDRKKEWLRTERTYNAMVMGEGDYAKSPQEAITQSYNRGETDEFIRPYVIERNGKPIAKIKNKDAVIFFNLRSDRARQMAKPFVQRDFNKMNPGSFKRKKVLENLVFVALTDFGPDLGNILTAYPSIDLINTLPMVIDGLDQLYIAEKEKFAHVTYFFNGGYANPVAGEDRIMIDSPNVASYDKKPAMSTAKIISKVIKELPKYDFICINFAIPDMVAHTGNFKAGVESVGHADKNIGKIFDAVKKIGGAMIITADHGNADYMINPKTDEVVTEHSKNPVPFILIEPGSTKRRLKKTGKLSDVAPTILKIMNLEQPEEMTGKSLF